MRKENRSKSIVPYDPGPGMLKQIVPTHSHRHKVSYSKYPINRGAINIDKVLSRKAKPVETSFKNLSLRGFSCTRSKLKLSFNIHSSFNPSPIFSDLLMIYPFSFYIYLKKMDTGKNFKKLRNLQKKTQEQEKKFFSFLIVLLYQTCRNEINQLRSGGKAFEFLIQIFLTMSILETRLFLLIPLESKFLI